MCTHLCSMVVMMVPLAGGIFVKYKAENSHAYINFERSKSGGMANRVAKKSEVALFDLGLLKTTQAI
jgi:hypothetical protein